MTSPVRDAEPTSREAGAQELRASGIRVLRGPNRWRLAPVVAFELHGGPADAVGAPPIERLLSELPAPQRAPDRGRESRIHAGLAWPELVAELAVELQRLAGGEVSFALVADRLTSGARQVVIGYAEEEVGIRSVREAVGILRACAAGQPSGAAAAVEELRALHDRVTLGPTATVMVLEARRRGIPVRRFAGDPVVQLGLGKHLRRLDATMSDMTSVIAADITSDKDRTKRVLARVGLAVPEGDVALTFEEAQEIAEDIGFPVLLKPLDANNGRGISARLDSAAGLRAAWERAVTEHPRVVVERYAEGRDHRVVVVDGRVVAVTERVPAHVIGDGERSIRALIEEVNRDPRRGKRAADPLAPLPADALTEEFLARSGRSLESVPGAGEMVPLRATANISTGGTPIDRTDEIHPDNVAACELAARTVGLDIAGLDVLTPDISVPFRQNGAVIIEVNASPGIRMHTHPVIGKPRNVPGAILDMLYPAGAPTTIPVIAVTGTNGKTTTTRLVAHLCGHGGRSVGYATTDGVYIRNRLVVEGDMSGPFAANVVLSNPTVEIAVIEAARGGILRAGLGFDECDVGVVLNVTADHLGLGGIDTLEQLAEVKGVIAATVKREGHAVLNADDPLVLAMRSRTVGDVVLFSVRGEAENPDVAQHIAGGGIAAVVQGDEFVIRRGGLCIPIALVREVPLTMGGAARFQFENVLAAIAAAYVQGLRYDDIRAGLFSFIPSPALMPGRLNLLRLGTGRVLVDYAHNEASVAGLVDFVERLDAARRIGVITAPGDRRDEDIRTVGRMFARFERLILKEGPFRRDRAPGETARLLAEGLAQGGAPPDVAEEVHDERAAIDRALELMGDGGLIVVLADDVPAVLDQLRPLTSGV